MIETKSVIYSSEKHFKGWAKEHRKRWGNEMKFQLSKSPILVYGHQYTVIPMTKHSPLFDIFNMMLLRLQAADVTEQLARFYYLDYFEEKEERELRPLQMGHMITGISICLIGLIMATFAFSAEIIAKNKYGPKAFKKRAVGNWFA